MIVSSNLIENPFKIQFMEFEHVKVCVGINNRKGLQIFYSVSRDLLFWGRVKEKESLFLIKNIIYLKITKKTWTFSRDVV